MSILPMPPDTWSRSLFRILLYVDIVFMLSYFLFAIEGPMTQENDLIISNWAKLCATLEYWTGLLVLFTSLFWIKKPIYGCIGAVIGFLSICMSIFVGSLASLRLK